MTDIASAIKSAGASITFAIILHGCMATAQAAPLGDIADFRHCVGSSCVDEWFTVYSADEIRALGAAQYCFVGIRVWFERIGPEDWKRRGRDEAFLLVDDCKKLDHMRPDQPWNHPNPALDRAEGMDHSKYTYRQWCWYSEAHCSHGQRYLTGQGKK